MAVKRKRSDLRLRMRLMPAVKCQATSSRTGKHCKKWAIRGGTVCRTHGGAAPQVKAAAEQRVKDMLTEALDPERVLREVGRIAFSDIRELFDADGNVLPVKQWPDDFARAVASVEVVKKNVTTGDGKVDDVLKVRLWDKVVKLTNLMKHHGLLMEKVEHTGSVDVVSILQSGRK